MFNKLKEVLLGTPRPPEGSVFFVSGLGVLTFNDDVDLWEIDIIRDGDTICFGMGPNKEPDKALIQHVIDIVEDLETFKEKITVFLESEKHKYYGYEDEISQLIINSVCFYNPDSLNDGMISFAGPDDFRLWRCDYIAKEPKNLGFDD